VKLVVHPLAVREINKTADRYRKISREVEVRFTESVAHAFDRARKHPESGEELAAGERRLLLRRFPYKLIYRPRPERVFIVALAHHRRREGYWRRRRETGGRTMEEAMSLDETGVPDDEILPEYSLAGGTRGRYAERWANWYEELQSRVLNLPATLRAQLADRLIASLQDDPDDRVARSWSEEAHRRLQAFHRGELDSLSEKDAIADLEQHLRDASGPQLSAE
jgi:toxin ParE1/3/4